MFPTPSFTLNYKTEAEITQVFIDLKNRKPFPDMPTVEAYLFVKAHKLADTADFYAYWTDGRSKDPLRQILDAHYPPLDYCHNLEDSFDLLPDYLAIAKSIL